jgi:hypothetical protein
MKNQNNGSEMGDQKGLNYQISKFVIIENSAFH